MWLSGLRLLICTAAAGVLLAASGQPGVFRQSPADPFAFFEPEVVITRSERRRLERDEAVARTLHGDNGQLAVFVATRLKAPPDALAVWTRAIAELKRSRFVLALGRFSDPPALSDVAGLVLDSRDLQEIRDCIPGDCGLKLSAPEIESLRRAVAGAGADWGQAAQAEFRRLLIARVNLYRRGGLAGLPPVAARQKPRYLSAAFTEILDRSPYLGRLPKVRAWLQHYPSSDDTSIESFFYWSKESYGTGKPVISVTHVGIVRPEHNREMPAVLVTGKQIFATHYVDGSLGLTMVLRGGPNGVSYLAYLNRSKLDLLGGFFGVFVRGVVERRVEREAPEIVRALRVRLEGGYPADGIEP